VDVLNCKMFVTVIEFQVVLVSHVLQLCLYSVMINMIRDIIVLFFHVIYR
jgi:hypothetical protein